MSFWVKEFDIKDRVVKLIINTGNRTDIPAYYSDWFYNRIREKFVLVRNPLYPEQIIKYDLTPDVVDVLCFCTKNPKPMLSRLDEISDFNQFWFVTITMYGRDVEPNVPEVTEVIKSFKELSKKVGINSIGLRYDPIFINEKYTVDAHLEAFERILGELSGFTNQCVISFIDLYEKTRRNFKEVCKVSKEEQEYLLEKIVQVGEKNNIKIYTCCENKEFEKYGVVVSGCMTKHIIEKAVGGVLDIPKGRKSSRVECECLLGNDIGMYNTCGHGCLYCYANYDNKTVLSNMKKHDKRSPILIGNICENDIINESKQVPYYNGQLKLF